jgi:rod shape-determining protein MreC
VSLKVKAKKNPKLLLGLLLVAHMAAISLNRIPSLSGQPTRRFAQVWLMTALMPFQWATAEAFSGVSGVWKNYFALRDSHVENERLKKALNEREAELIKAKEDLSKAVQLHSISEWQATQSGQSVVGRVIARDADQWFGTVVLDRGSGAGVEKDQPVVTPEGLVGRIIEVSPNASRVLLLTDERHGAGAIIGQLSNERVLGVVTGKNSSLCEMKFLAPPEKVEVGEVVTTSGQDGIYPSGLVIGKVKRIEGVAASPTAVEVEPTAPLSKLDIVAVMSVTKQDIRGSVDELLDHEKAKQVKPAPRKRR